LLIYLDEAGAWRVEIEYHEDHGARETRGDDGRQSGSERVKPARITQQSHAIAKSDVNIASGIWFRNAERRLPWLSIMALSVWIKSPVGTMLLSLAETAFTCCHSSSWIWFMTSGNCVKDLPLGIRSTRVWAYSRSNFNDSVR
jgi:hypothetical protein